MDKAYTALNNNDLIARIRATAAEAIESMKMQSEIYNELLRRGVNMPASFFDPLAEKHGAELMTSVYDWANQRC